MTDKVLERGGDQDAFLNPGRVPLKRIKNFLSWLANLPIDDPKATEKFLHDFGDFFFVNGDFRRHREVVALIDKKVLPEPPKGDYGPFKSQLSPEQLDHARHLILDSVQSLLREAWTNYDDPHIRKEVIAEARDSYDPREREWIIDELRHYFWDGLIGVKYDTPLSGVLQYRRCPPNYRFEQAMDYLKNNLKLAKVCANRFCTQTPYFLAERASQIYCSDLCAAPAKKAAKLKWWNENRRKEKS